MSTLSQMAGIRDPKNGIQFGDHDDFDSKRKWSHYSQWPNVLQKNCEFAKWWNMWHHSNCFHGGSGLNHYGNPNPYTKPISFPLRLANASWIRVCNCNSLLANICYVQDLHRSWVYCTLRNQMWQWHIHHLQMIFSARNLHLKGFFHCYGK